MKPIQLQESRKLPSSQAPVWVVEEQAARAQVPALARPAAPLSLWRSAMQRRVKHPRLQFDKGVRVDVLA